MDICEFLFLKKWRIFKDIGLIREKPFIFKLLLNYDTSSCDSFCTFEKKKETLACKFYRQKAFRSQLFSLHAKHAEQSQHHVHYWLNYMFMYMYFEFVLYLHHSCKMHDNSFCRMLWNCFKERTSAHCVHYTTATHVFETSFTCFAMQFDEFEIEYHLSQC